MVAQLLAIILPIYPIVKREGSKKELTPQSLYRAGDTEGTEEERGENRDRSLSKK
jgi:hypothetical protein